MNFAQYLPTSLQGLMPDGTGSDPNQLPQDDTMMQLELKRKFALADALKNQAMPQGQMVGDRYVAPSWTQYLANAVGKYKGGQAENEAIKQYGDYKTAENTRMAEALGKFGKAFEPTTTTNTTYAPGIGKELAVGDTVQTAPNYSPTSNANEMVAPTSPYGTQNMTGNATTSVPTTTTSTVQPTANSINQAFTDYSTATRNPKLAEQLMMSRFTDYQKRNDPFKLSKDETLFGRDANGNLVKLATNPGENTQFGKINPSEYTPASVATFMQTGKQSDLVSAKPAVVPTTRNMRQGNQDITQQWNPSTNSWQTIATGNAFKPDAPVDKQSVENTASMIASGQIQPLSGFAMKTPWGQQVMSRVSEMNPSYSGATFANVKQAQQKFNVGKQGDTVRSLNVATNHLDTLGGLADALNNNDIQALNKVSNIWKTQTGQVAPTNFEGAKKIVADEVVKAIVGSGGGVADREEAARSIQAASSPQQLKGIINTYKDLMHGQLTGLRQQYETSTGKKDFNKYLSPSVLGNNVVQPTGQSSVRSQADAILGNP